MKVSIIIPNRNDSVMLGVTIRTALECLREVDNDGEIIVVDNSDEDIYRILLKPNISPIPIGYRKTGLLKIIRQDFPSMYSAAQTGAEHAQGKYLMKSDSHVIWGRGVVKDCVEFMDSHENAGFCFSPIGWMSRTDMFAKSYIMKNANGGIFGPWGKKIELPAKISWNFGFRIVRKDWFFKCGGFSFFADEKVSWGGGEFYTAMKSWLLGRENWAINTNPIYHIGPHSKEVESLGYRFRLYGSSGNGRQGMGILAAFYALGGDGAKEEALKSKDGLGKQYGINIERDWGEAKKIAQKDHEWILQNQVVSFNELLEKEPWNEH